MNDHRARTVRCVIIALHDFGRCLITQKLADQNDADDAHEGFRWQRARFSQRTSAG